MAQDRGKKRGTVSLVTCTLLLLLGVLGLSAGCSSHGEGAEDEGLGSQSQAQFGCACPMDNPCATFSCVGDQCVASQKIKEGEPCGGKILGYTGLCHLNVCCPGCVVASKFAPPECARNEGMANTQCGATGTTCENCTLDKCQIPACDGKSCNLRPVDEGGACVGTTGFCTKGDCCKGCVDGDGACQPGNTLTQCGIAENSVVKCDDCSDAKPCTADACIAGKCTAPAVPPGTSCDDGNACNGISECSGTSCTSGTALDCDDKDPCTVDTCDPQGGCKHTIQSGLDCNDKDACTTGEKCNAAGACVGGVVNTCDDNKSCTTDKCVGGLCTHTAVNPGTTCNDGNGCTTTDACNDDGECIGTGGPTCDDENQCTKNACAANICSNPFESVTTACISANKCVQNSHCSGTSGTCVDGPPVDCDDDNDCTDDSCDPASGCMHAPTTKVVECVDGNACTVMDKCVAGECVGTPMPCLALDACHEAGECDPDTGRCDDPRSEDGKDCPGGACVAGVCDPDAVVSEGGAGNGGAAQGDAGEATGGVLVGAGGQSTGDAGEATTPGDGGTTAEPVEHPFVRNPGGCSCQVPGNGRASGALMIVGLALAAAVRRRRPAPRAQG